ncbi:serine/threonine-protein kinase [Streptomyces sp. NPDC057686]|uniref:serine/threonine-protein kinase n=1 Tax=Streptomyces sp. NPDC057686 TaxID=3346212 RepID=UPI00369EBCF6
MEQLKAGDPAAVGPYRITARLGAGGAGQVYLGESRSGRRAAVKVVRPEIASDPGFRARFRREVEAAKAVGGFWTATVVDADPVAETPWVAGDYIPAPHLAERVREDGPLREDAVWRLGAGLAEALHCVHRAGLVHRDLKPANVLLTENGPRLIDFGIAKALNGATMLTRTGVAIGTAGFMSPEQAQGGRVGTASDIFSLGTVLCFAATGRMPFGEGSAAEPLYRVVHEMPNLERLPEGRTCACGSAGPDAYVSTSPAWHARATGRGGRGHGLGGSSSPGRRGAEVGGADRGAVLNGTHARRCRGRARRDRSARRGRLLLRGPSPCRRIGEHRRACPVRPGRAGDGARGSGGCTRRCCTGPASATRTTVDFSPSSAVIDHEPGRGPDAARTQCCTH